VKDIRSDKCRNSDAFARSLRQLAWHRVELLQYQFADQPLHVERGEDSRLRLNGMSLTAFIKMAEERLSL